MSSTLLPPGAGRRFGPLMTTKVEFGQSEDFAVFESALPPHADGPPPHLHRVYDEAFYVLEGAIAITVDGTTTECPAGSCAFVGRGAVHGFGNPAPEPARLLVITTPEAIRLVEQANELMAQEPPDRDAILALFAAHQSELVGLPTP
ncbi:cupin domain-containing protein [Pseudonocardia halophobica]|uniref:cupin domain-containing protein n=1 Tax=Pseudonocardia halophobica TaxID=29401 RepID=UPI003D9347FE